MKPLPRRRGRPPGMSVDRLRKRYLIAQAIVAGVKIAEVARQLGVSRSWASREANTQVTRDLLAQLLAPHAERMAQMLHTSYEEILEALDAEKVVRINGTKINLGPDHLIRLEAVAVAIQFFKRLKHTHWHLLNRMPHTGTAAPQSARQPDHRTRLAAARCALRFIERWDPLRCKNMVPLPTAAAQPPQSRLPLMRSRLDSRRCTHGTARESSQ